MQLHTNETPRVDLADKPTGCCPRFHPEAWDDQELHFADKKFVRASTKSVMHVPVNMGSVFSRTWKAIEDAHAGATGLLVLSHDTSPWKAEHLFAVEDDVPGAEMVKLSGTFLSRVFDGPYSRMGEWQQETVTGRMPVPPRARELHPRDARPTAAPDTDGIQRAVTFAIATT